MGCIGGVSPTWMVKVEWHLEKRCERSLGGDWEAGVLGRGCSSKYETEPEFGLLLIDLLCM